MNSFNENDFFANIEKHAGSIPPEYRQKIMGRIDELRNYVPKIGVFGKTGVGKSSLCNALFGQEVCEISDFKACTREPKEVLMSITSGNGLKLIDVPGVGESSERDNEYEALYQSLLPELDLVFWVFKADDRAHASDEKFFKSLIRPYIDEGKPFLAVINQVDKMEPFKEWSEEESKPGPRQLSNIQKKKTEIAAFLNLPLSKVVPVSANEYYGLMDLVDSVVHALPNDKKLVVLEKIQQAEKSKIESEQQFQSRRIVSDGARNEAVETVWSNVTSWFRWW